MMLFCPAGRHRWDWDGNPIVLPSLWGGKDVAYDPKPTPRGICTCGFCQRQPVPPHLPPNAGSGRDDAGPWQENAVKILEM